MRISDLLFRVLTVFFLLIGSNNLRAKEPVPVRSTTIMINGFGSNVPAIGHGLESLHKKIPGSILYSYAGPVDGLAIVAPKVLADARKAFQQSPNSAINLIGVSFGANLATRLIATLHKEGIQISYLGIIDGLPLAPITPNVRRVDNFTCTRIGCLKDKIKLTRDNSLTLHFAFEFDTNHIDVPAHPDIHDRIISQISTYSLELGTETPVKQD